MRPDRLFDKTTTDPLQNLLGDKTPGGPLQPSSRNEGRVVMCPSCGAKNRLSLAVPDAAQRCGLCKAPLVGYRVILCDVSGSMKLYCGERRAIDILAEALQDLFPKISLCKLITFSSSVQVIQSPGDLPEPNGITAMHLGLQTARMFQPERTLVISDGWPDDRAAALSAAEALTGAIDILYIGPDDDHEALEFMRSLVRRSGGEVDIVNLEIDGGRGLLKKMERLLLTDR